MMENKKELQIIFFSLFSEQALYIWLKFAMALTPKTTIESKTILLSFTYKTILLFIQRKSRSAKKALHSFIALIEFKWSTSE